MAVNQEQLGVVEDSVMLDLIEVFGGCTKEVVRAEILNRMADYLIHDRPGQPTVSEFFFTTFGFNIDIPPRPYQPLVGRYFRNLELEFRTGANCMVAFFSEDDLVRPTSMGLIVPRPPRPIPQGATAEVQRTLSWKDGRLLGELTAPMAQCDIAPGVQQLKIRWGTCLLAKTLRSCHLDSGELIVEETTVLGSQNIANRIEEIEDIDESLLYMQGLVDTERTLRSTVAQAYSE